MKMEVLSSNGLSIKIDLSILHKPVADRIGYLHDNLGTNYLEKIIKPAVRSVTRQVIGNYLPEELYNTKRKEIEEEIYKQLFDKDIYPIGSYIKINDINYNVVGMYKDGQIGSGGPQGNIHIPFTTFQQVYKEKHVTFCFGDWWYLCIWVRL